MINDKNLRDAEEAGTQLQAFDYSGWREKFVLAVLRVASLTGVLLIAASYNTATPRDRILFISLYIILVALTFFRVSYRNRSLFLLATVFLIGLNAILAWGPWLDGSIFFISFVTLTALLFDRPADYISFGISLFTFIFVVLLHQAGMITLSGSEPYLETTLQTWVPYIIDFAVPSLLILYAIAQFKQEFSNIAGKMQTAFDNLSRERSQLEKRVAERTELLEVNASQLRSSNNVARTVAEIQDTTELIDTVTTMISGQFGYYRVGLYLLDEKKRIAFLQSTNNNYGPRDSTNQIHQIEQDRRNPLNIVVNEKRHVLTSDLKLRFGKDPNFPLTRSRMLMPLRVRGDVIGVLDLHSDQVQTFNQIDPDILQSLADLIAISIDNARLLNETKALLSQLENYTSMQTLDTWSKQTSRNAPAYQYTPAGVRPLFSPNSPEDERSIKIPLILHDQTIGAIKMRRKGTATQWAEREIALVEKVAEQVSLALENSRLVEEAQKNAQRDQVIANISSRIRETLDLDSVIRTAAAEFRRVFDLKESEINIGSPESQPDSPKRHTGMLKLR